MPRNRLRRSCALALACVTTIAFGACGGDDDDDSAQPSSTSATSPTAASAAAQRDVVTGAGSDVATAVDKYRALLGDDNGGEPTTHESGRREINWDAVPDEFAAPNALPADFFNAPADPRARGVVLETEGDHVAVSADDDNPENAAPRFADINPSYTDTFSTFSEPRLFSPVGSNVVNLQFYVPGTSTPAVARGFGAVYTDVDREETASFELFDAQGHSLETFAVPVSKNGLSFLGIAYAEPVVARVRIVYGNTELGPDDDDQYDVAVMDDFIFGEPQPAG
jgi:hypothetical protein